MGNLKKRGFLILPTILSIFIVGMLGVALSAIYGGMFSTLSAGKGASQAQQYAAVESEYVKLQGYDNADNVVHGWKTMEALTGEDDGKNWESKVTLERTKKTDSGNTVKVMKVATRKNGDLISRYSSEVPLVEGYDVYSKAEIDQMFTTLSSQISQLSSDLDAFKKATADNFTTINNNINQIKSNLDDLSKMLGTETQARIDADKAISNTISNETKARQDADKALSNQIDSLKSSLTDLQSALNTEVSNRQAADKALQSNIDSETSARKAADAAEANARKQAISDLQAQINSKYDELYNLYKGLKSRLDGNEFVKSKNGENNIALKYEQKDGEDKKTLHAYVDGVEVPLASQGSNFVLEWKDIVEGSTGKESTQSSIDYSTVKISRFIYAKTSKGTFYLGDIFIRELQHSENFEWGGHNLYIECGLGFQAYLSVDSNSYKGRFKVIVDSGQF